jgi:hypothetical protein
MTILTRLVGHLRCWLGNHAWATTGGEPGRADTLLAYAERCRRCGAERDTDCDL